MKNIGVIINNVKRKAADILPRLLKESRRLGLTVRTCSPFSNDLPGVECLDPNDFSRHVDAIVSLGGDGTLLRAVSMLGDAPLPVLGVNLGRLGFLTSVTEPELEKGLQALVSGTFTTSARTMLDARILTGGVTERFHTRALNDMVLGWGQSTRIITLDVSIDHEPVTSYRCDGIIVSTPTGSTGHSLSAGGPIIHPEASVLVLNVICPHTLSARPLVIPDRARISIVVKQTGKKLLLSVDGQDGESLTDGDALVIQKSPTPFHLVHLPGYNYFSVLRKKLHWSGSSSEHIAS